MSLMLMAHLPGLYQRSHLPGHSYLDQELITCLVKTGGQLPRKNQTVVPALAFNFTESVDSITPQSGSHWEKSAGVGLQWLAGAICKSFRNFVGVLLARNGSSWSIYTMEIEKCYQSALPHTFFFLQSQLLTFPSTPASLTSLCFYESNLSSRSEISTMLQLACLLCLANQAVFWSSFAEEREE